MAFTVVQTASSASASLSFASNITAGNGVVVVTQGTTVTPSSGPDTYSNAETSTGSNIYYCSSSAGGYKTISFGGSNVASFAYEVTPGVTLDGGNTGSGTSTTYSSGSYSSTTGTEFWVGGANATNIPDGITPTISGASGWTNASVQTGFDSEYVAGYQLRTATGSATYSGSVNYNGGTHGAWRASVATFRALPATTVTLTTAQVNTAAGAVTPVHAATVLLQTAQVNVAANPVTPGVVKTLVASVSAAAGTDSFSNSYPAGFAALAGSAYLRLFTMSSVPQLNASSGSPKLSTGGAAVGSAVIAQSDFTGFTVNQTVQTQLAKNWAVPLADLQVGAAWRLTAAGTGTQGSTAETLSVYFNAFGSTAYHAVDLSAALILLSTAFRWRAVTEFVCTAVSGTSFTFTAGGAFTVSTSATSSTSMGTGVYDTAFTSTITSATNCELAALWGGAPTTKPTLTSAMSLFEKVV